MLTDSFFPRHSRRGPGRRARRRPVPGARNAPRCIGNRRRSRIMIAPRNSIMSDAVSTENLALPSWSYKVKKAAWIGLAIVGALAALLLIAPHFIDLGLFKRTYLPLVEDALNRRLDVGEVRLSLVPTPSIRLSHLKVFDAPAFADNTFFAAEQVRLRLRLWPLLKGRFEVTELELDKPVFNLLKQPDGTFNYSDIAKKPAAGARREARR